MRLASPQVNICGRVSGTHKVGDDGPQASFRHRRDITPQTRAWLRHHRLDDLEDADRSPVRLDLRRLRKSYKSQQYVRAAGILPDFTVGHTREAPASVGRSTPRAIAS